MFSARVLKDICVCLYFAKRKNKESLCRFKRNVSYKSTL